jgi:hypothetical protein
MSNSGKMFFFLFIFVYGAAYSQDTMIVKPKEISAVLINPGMGFTTFHHFNRDHVGEGKDWDPQKIEDLLLPNGDLKYCEYPPSSIAYFRWYWDEIEPEQGKYNWDLIDRTIDQARQNGQKLAFRIMPQNGEPKAPAWYRKIARGFTYENGKSWMPDYEDPLFHKHFGDLVAALGKRYDGNPDIDHIDMGIVGRWGEWHTSQTGYPMPSTDTQIAFADLYRQAFAKSLLVMLIGGGEAMAHSIRQGTGWRADCLGDMGGFSKNWNHMEDLYPIELSKAGALDAWEKAPVVFESCWTMQYWADQSWDIKDILDRALKYHASVFNNKSSIIPKEHWGLVNDFLRKMGYRFALRRIQMPEEVQPGATMKMETLWENIGVSPSYHPFQVVYQIKNENTSIEHVSKTDIRNWLPGYHLIEEQIQIPENNPSGSCQLRIALLDPNTRKPAVRLAIEGRDSDGWYTLCQFRIQK